MPLMKHLTESEAQLVLDALKAGRSLREICCGKRGPKLAQYYTFRRYCAAHPEYEREAMALVERNYEKGRAARVRALMVEEKRAQTHCKRGHLFTPENTRVKRSDQSWTMGRQCKICALEKEQFRGPLLKPEVRAEVIRALKRRATYTEIRAIVKDMGAFYRTRRRDPEFAALCLDWSSASRERMARRALAKNGRKQFEWIMSLIPARVAPDDRIEIVSMVVEAHKRRTFRRKPFGITKTPQRMREFVSEFYKQNPTKAYGRVDSPWSLDAPIGFENDTRLIDTVSEGLW